MTAVDEAHNTRNLGRAYFSALFLRRKSEFFLAMTATPVNTKLLVRVMVVL